MITNHLVANITSKNALEVDHEAERRKMKNKVRLARKQGNINKLEEIRSRLSEQEKRTNTANQEVGSYNWLTVLPLSEQHYYLNKEEFRDALRLRYNWNIPRLPATCACNLKFSVDHALSCKKGGFITLRHNEIRDITASVLNEVCKDVELEPLLIPLNGETFKNKSSIKGDEARLDISANGFWIRGQKAFLDIRVFNHNALRYSNQTLKKCYTINEEEKKRHYNERVLEVENGSFTPLVFSANGGMGRQCKLFYQRLSDMVAEKKELDNASVTSWLRTKINFSLLRSMILCIRGSRSLKKKELDMADLDTSLINTISRINSV